MPNRKTVLAVIAWVVLGLSVFTVMQLTKYVKTEELRSAFKDKITAVRDTILSNLAISRNPPLTTVDLEESLKLYVRVPFTNFSRDDWDYFWHLLYGKFPDDSNTWPRRKRQLTREEVESELADYYGAPFSYFSDSQWSVFWKNALRGKVF